MELEESEDGGGGGWHEGCCKPRKCIHFVAWSHIIIYSSVSIMVVVTFLVPLFMNAGSDVYAIFGVTSLILLILIGQFLPLTPVMIVAHGTELFWPEKIQKAGFLPSVTPLVFTEVGVLVIFITFAIILLTGCKQQLSRWLRGWTIFAWTCFGLVTLETIVGVTLVLVYKWQDNDFYILGLEVGLVLIRFGLSILFYILPIRAVQHFMRQISEDGRTLKDFDNPIGIFQSSHRILESD